MEQKKEISKESQPGQTFRIQLTQEELNALMLLMPQNYSLQAQPRKKDGKNNVKKKAADQLLLLSISEPLSSRVRLPAVHPAPPPQPPPKKVVPKPDPIPQALKPCLKTLQSLQQHKCALPFLQPVDVQALNIPEYLQIVKQPMDLSTIESKLKSGKYQTPSQFHQDIIKIFQNSYSFNSVNEDFIKLTAEFQKYYYRISGETKPVVQKPVVKQQPPVVAVKSQKKKKKPPTGSRQFNESHPITTEEKRQLANQIHRLAKQHIKGVKSIVFQTNTDQNEFDLEQLPQKKLRELQKYVRNKMVQMENNNRASLLQKGESQNLDQLESDVSEEFIDTPLNQ